MPETKRDAWTVVTSKPLLAVYALAAAIGVVSGEFDAQGATKADCSEETHCVEEKQVPSVLDLSK